MFSSLRNFHPLRVAASAGLKGALPKVLVGAALLGGGGSVLFAGSAQAQVAPPVTCASTSGATLTAGDKIVSNIVCGGDVAGTATPITFGEVQGVFYDFGAGFIPGGSLAGSISYAIDIFKGSDFFATVELDSECDILAGTTGSCTVTKDVLFGEGLAKVIPSLVSINGANAGPVPLPGHLTSLYIIDSWTTTPTAAVVAVDNSFTQKTKVPGPLPLLGAGMAFGFSRKLRSRIKARVQA